MTTATTIISDALGALGIVASGESLEADHALLGLRLLNRMIDTMGADSSLDYRTKLQTFSVATASTTIGLTGSIVTTERVDVLRPGCYATFSGNDYPLTIATSRQQYTDIVRKSLAGPVPVVVWLDTTYPDSTLYLWPIPQGSASLTIAYGCKQSAFADLNTNKALPSGLEQAYVDMLTVKIAPHFGMKPPEQAIIGAREAKALIRRMRFEPPQLTVNGPITTGAGLTARTLLLNIP